MFLSNDLKVLCGKAEKKGSSTLEMVGDVARSVCRSVWSTAKRLTTEYNFMLIIHLKRNMYVYNPKGVAQMLIEI